jgi:Holliday junction resolvase RusA-like endonuclease
MGRRGTQSFLTPETKAFYVLVRRCIEDQGRQPIVDYPVSVTWTVTVPDRRVRDGSNLLKCLEDGLTKAGVWTDDNFSVVRSTTILWNGVVAKPGSVTVEICRLPDEDSTDF